MTLLIPRIETSRLLLRPFAADDADDVFAYAGDPEFWRYLPIPALPYTREDAAAFVAAVVARDPAERTEWAIEHAGRVIGGINIRPQLINRRAGMGYGIGRAWWGQRLTTEAAHAAVTWAFSTLPIVRVFATADARNTGSWRVMQHLGMKHEATLRLHRTQDGEQADEVVYGVLRQEWEANSI